MVIFHLLGRPALRWLGGADTADTRTTAVLDAEVSRSPARAQALRCRLTAARDGWQVSEGAVLSCFSFAKEAMYRDLLDHEDLEVMERVFTLDHQLLPHTKDAFFDVRPVGLAEVKIENLPPAFTLYERANA